MVGIRSFPFGKGFSGGCELLVLGSVNLGGGGWISNYTFVVIDFPIFPKTFRFQRFGQMDWTGHPPTPSKTHPWNVKTDASHMEPPLPKGTS